MWKKEEEKVEKGRRKKFWEHLKIFFLYFKLSEILYN